MRRKRGVRRGDGYAVGCGGRGLDGHQGFLADIETLPHEETPSSFLRKELPESQIKVYHLCFGSSQQLPKHYALLG